VASVSLPTADVYDPTRSQSIVFEAMVYVKAYKAYGISDVPLLSLYSGWNASLEMRELMWATGPMMDGGTQTLLDSQTQGQFLTPFQWHRVRMSIDPNNYIVSIDDNEVARYATGEFSNWGNSDTVALTLGNFDGWIDEVLLKNVEGPAAQNSPPTVSIISPAYGQIFAAPAALTLTASASDSDGSISRVDFYQGSSLVGSATTAPYTVTLPNVGAGTYSFTAKAFDNGGASTTSSSVSVTVHLNSPPTVAITSPINGQTLPAPAALTLTASASDSDGSISRVEFYLGSSLISSVTTAPYTLTFPSVGAGTYSFTAKAYDNSGASTTSSPVSVTVQLNSPPTVSITSPVNGQTFAAPATLTLTANASDSGGSIARVEFYRGNSLVGSATTAPYSVTLPNVGAGTYSFTAKAIENSGASTTSSPVSVTVQLNSPPTVSITSPVNGQTFAAPAAVTLTASASDPGGSIARVDFYRGSSLVGSVTTAPYSFTLSNVGVGIYLFTAKAFDNSGASTTSSSVWVTVKRNSIRIAN
jgi:Bacterial Ig domain